MKVIDFGTVMVDGKVLVIPHVVKEMIVADIKASNCFPATMQYVLEEQGVISGGCTLTIYDFVLDGDCVLSEGEKVEEDKKPGWWLISAANVDEIKWSANSYLADYPGVRGNDMRNILCVFETGLHLTDAVPDDYPEGTDKMSEESKEHLSDLAKKCGGKLYVGSNDGKPSPVVLDDFEEEFDKVLMLSDKAWGRVKHAFDIDPDFKDVDWGAKSDRGVLEGYVKKELVANFCVTFVMMRAFILGILSDTTLTELQETSLIEKALNAFEKSFDLIKE